MAQSTRAEICPECHGGRLNKEALHYFIGGKNIGEVASMELTHLASWLEGLEDKLTDQQRTIATEVLKEIRTRLSFLLDVGLGYLSMNRMTASLSGGESQRIRLATQIVPSLSRYSISLMSRASASTSETMCASSIRCRSSVIWEIPSSSSSTTRI